MNLLFFFQLTFVCVYLTCLGGLEEGERHMPHMCLKYMYTNLLTLFFEITCKSYFDASRHMSTWLPHIWRTYVYEYVFTYWRHVYMCFSRVKVTVRRGADVCHICAILMYMNTYILFWTLSYTGRRRPIGCLKLQVVSRQRTTSCRALLRKMTYKDKASYGSSPPCTICTSHTSMHPSHMRVLNEWRYVCTYLRHVYVWFFHMSRWPWGGGELCTTCVIYICVCICWVYVYGYVYVYVYVGYVYMYMYVYMYISHVKVRRGRHAFYICVLSVYVNMYRCVYMYVYENWKYMCMYMQM